MAVIDQTSIFVFLSFRTQNIICCFLKLPLLLLRNQLLVAGLKISNVSFFFFFWSSFNIIVFDFQKFYYKEPRWEFLCIYHVCCFLDFLNLASYLSNFRKFLAIIYPNMICQYHRVFALLGQVYAQLILCTYVLCPQCLFFYIFQPFVFLCFKVDIFI